MGRKAGGRALKGRAGRRAPGGSPVGGLQHSPHTGGGGGGGGGGEICVRGRLPLRAAHTLAVARGEACGREQTTRAAGDSRGVLSSTGIAESTLSNACDSEGRGAGEGWVGGWGGGGSAACLPGGRVEGAGVGGVEADAPDAVRGGGLGGRGSLAHWLTGPGKGQVTAVAVTKRCDCLRLADMEGGHRGGSA